MVTRIDQAMVSTDGSGRITVDDPQSPLVVSAEVDCSGPRRRVTAVEVRLRDGVPGSISTATLAKIPLAGLAIYAAPTSHPGDRHWRSMVRSRDGSRSWPGDHWRLVADVARWAAVTRRPGGPAEAIAEFWGVTRYPTAYRWLRKARELGHLNPHPGTPSNAAAAACGS